MNKHTDKSKLPQVFATQQPKPSPRQTDIPRPQPVAAATLTHEDIARRAYQIYVERGCPQDQSEEIWLQAEQDIKRRGLATSLSK
jgi:hypothetical protein